MLTNCLKDGDLTVRDGVFIHSKSENTNLYDRIWNKKSKNCSFDEGETDNRYWSEKVNRKLRLLELFNPSSIHKPAGEPKTDEYMIITMNSMPLNGATVLDVCAGHGFYSIAAIELGANSVVSCDGSIKALSQYSDKLNNSTSLSEISCRKAKNILRVQADANNLLKVFKSGYFDLSFMRMAIHHLKNPFVTMRDLATVTNPGGYIAFDCFLTGCTSEITRKLRDHFCKRDLIHVSNFLFHFGKVKNDKAEVNQNPLKLKNIFNNMQLISSDYYEDIEFLKSMMSKYSAEDIENKLHMEDFQTQYIHNLDPNKIANFCVNDLGLSCSDYAVFNAFPGELPDRGCFTFRVPSNWKVSNIDFPQPENGIEFK